MADLVQKVASGTLNPEGQALIDRALGISLSPSQVRKGAAVALAEYGLDRLTRIARDGADKDAVNAIKVLGEVGVGQKTEVIVSHMDVLGKVAEAAAETLDPATYALFAEALRRRLEDA